MSKISLDFFLNNSVQEIWDKMNISSKACYRLLKNPGKEIDNYNESNYPPSDNPMKGRKNFSIIIIKINKIEWLYLSSAGHRRAIFNYNNSKLESKWLAP